MFFVYRNGRFVGVMSEAEADRYIDSHPFDDIQCVRVEQ